MIILLAGVSLTACGGSGDGAPPTAPIEESPDPQAPPESPTPPEQPPEETPDPPGQPGSGNQPPRISGTAPATVAAGQVYTFQPQASDPEGDLLSFTIANKPAWASFDTSTGRLSGTPSAGHVGEYADIEIAATDGQHVTPMPRFTITVTAINAGGGDGGGDDGAGSGSVTLAWDAPTQNADGSALTDLQGYKVHYGTAPRSYSESIVIDNAGVTRYVVDLLEPGTYYFAVTAFNSQGMESEYSSEVSTTLN